MLLACVYNIAASSHTANSCLRDQRSHNTIQATSPSSTVDGSIVDDSDLDHAQIIWDYNESDISLLSMFDGLPPAMESLLDSAETVESMLAFLSNDPPQKKQSIIEKMPFQDQSLFFAEIQCSGTPISKCSSFGSMTLVATDGFVGNQPSLPQNTSSS